MLTERVLRGGVVLATGSTWFCPCGAYGLEGKPVSYQAKKHVTRNSTAAVAAVVLGERPSGEARKPFPGE